MFLSSRELCFHHKGMHLALIQSDRSAQWASTFRSWYTEVQCAQAHSLNADKSQFRFRDFRDFGDSGECSLRAGGCRAARSRRRQPCTAVPAGPDSDVVRLIRRGMCQIVRAPWQQLQPFRERPVGDTQSRAGHHLAVVDLIRMLSLNRLIAVCTDFKQVGQSYNCCRIR